MYLWCTIHLHLEQSCSSCSPVCWLHWIAGVSLTFNSPLSFKLSSLPVGDDSGQEWLTTCRVFVASLNFPAVEGGVLGSVQIAREFS